MRQTSRTRLPVIDGGADEIIGVLYVKDLYDAFETGKPFDIRALVREAPIVSDLSDAMQVIEALRKSTAHLVLVFDEYGHFEGVISSGDILESIMGALQDGSADEQAVVRREDGTYLVAGWMQIDEFAAFMDFRIDDDVEFQTVAGLVLDELKRIPELGESFEKNGWRFEVIDLDGRRVDKVLVTPPKDRIGGGQTI